MHKNIVVFIPKAGFRSSYEAKFIESFTAAKDYLYAKASEIPFTFTISQYFSHTFPIDANRNECVSMAIKNNIDLSIFLDTDHILPPDTLFKLIKHDLPIVAGVYYLKGEPHPPVIYLENKELSDDFNVFNSIYYIDGETIYERKELFPADMAGAGCFAISLDVLKKLKKPYFAYRPIPESLITVDEKQAHSGKREIEAEMQEILDNWNPDTKFKVENDIYSATEDVHFWRNVRYNTDYKLMIDPTISLPHGPLDVWIDAGYSEVYFKTRVSKAPDIDQCKIVTKNGKAQPVKR